MTQAIFTIIYAVAAILTAILVGKWLCDKFDLSKFDILVLSAILGMFWFLTLPSIAVSFIIYKLFTRQ